MEGYRLRCQVNAVGSVVGDKLKPIIEINGFKLVKTCNSFPEQYDVFNADNKQVAYFRLRGGHFSATVPDVGGEVVYKAEPNGNGEFDDDERMKYLTEAIQAIENKEVVT